MPGAGQAPHITSNCRKAFRDVSGAVFVTLVLLLVGSEFDARLFMGSPFEGFHLSEVRLPGNALIMGIRWGGDVIVPRGDTTLAVGK